MLTAPKVTTPANSPKSYNIIQRYSEPLADCDLAKVKMSIQSNPSINSCYYQPKINGYNREVAALKRYVFNVIVMELELELSGCMRWLPYRVSTIHLFKAATSSLYTQA